MQSCVQRFNNHDIKYWHLGMSSPLLLLYSVYILAHRVVAIILESFHLILCDREIFLHNG